MNLLEQDIKRIKQLMILEDQLDTDINLSKTGSDQDIKQKGPSTDDGNNDSEDGMGESELGEEEGTTSTDTTTDTKSDTGSSITPWESGRTLGPTYKGPKAKWESGIGKGPSNKTATEKWASGRTMGPTGKNYKV